MGSQFPVTHFYPVSTLIKSSRLHAGFQVQVACILAGLNGLPLKSSHSSTRSSLCIAMHSAVYTSAAISARRRCTSRRPSQSHAVRVGCRCRRHRRRHRRRSSALPRHMSVQQRSVSNAVAASVFAAALLQRAPTRPVTVTVTAGIQRAHATTPPVRTRNASKQFGAGKNDAFTCKISAN